MGNNSQIDKTTDKDEAIIRLAGSNDQLLDIETVGGKNKAHVIAEIQVSELLGVVIRAFNYFAVTAAPLNSTFQVHGFDSVDVTSTVTASEAGDVHATAQLIVDDLNADNTFNAIWEAYKPEGCPKVFVHSLVDKSGNCNEEATFSVTVAGGAARTLGYGDGLKQRPVPIAIFPHPDDPEYGTMSITGAVSVSAKSVQDYFSEKGTEPGGSPDLTVDGSTTPVDFKVEASSTEDLIITEIRISLEDGGINFTKFMDIQPLANGVELEIKTKGAVASFSPVLQTTNDIVLLFNSGGLDTFIHLGKRLVGTFKPDNPFILKKGSSDYVCMRVQDDLRGLVAFEYAVKGYKG